MKKPFLVAIALAVCGFSNARAQSVAFIYNDGGAGGGLANSGTYTPGSSFTFSITLKFVPGGSISNLDGLTYSFTQQSPVGGPFPATISLRDATGSPFTELQTPGLTYPQNISPTNASDLGGAVPSPGPGPVGFGSYLVANITVSIPLNAANQGTFVISNTTLGPETSFISDSLGHTFAIPESDYTITMVPEPATWLAPILGVATLFFTQRRKIAMLRA